jgi:HK97 family phage major capsid protein
MKLKEKMRLAVLKALATPTDEQATEMAALETKATEANLDIAELCKTFAADADGDGGDDVAHHTSEAQLVDLITKAVGAAVPDGSGVDTAKLIGEIQAAAKANKTEGITAKQVEDIVVKHNGGTGIDKEALVAEIKSLMPSQGVTEATLAKALSDFAASIKMPAANEFATGASDRDFPFEHRGQNLTVAEKQLANVCLAHVSEEAKSKVKAAGGTVPTSMNHGIADDQLAYAEKRGANQLKGLRHSVMYGGKALTTGSAGNGLELIPSDLASDLQARMYLESQVAAEFLASEIDMPTATFKFPMTTSRPNFYVGTEAPDPHGLTESTSGTALITLDAKKLIGYSEYSYEADEDAIVAVLPIIQEGLAAGAADAFEGALINGDTTATHMDSDINAVAGHSSKLFKGLRKLALAGSTTKDLTTGDVSASNIAAMRKQMLRWGLKPRDLMLIVGPQGYNDAVTLAETLTFDKVGNANAARILTGEAGSIYGIRIVVSSQVREDLNATGVYDGVTTTKGSMLLVHRPSFIVGVKRGFTVEVDTDKRRQVNQVIASFRRDFVPKETVSTSIPTVVLGYNNDVA